MARFFRIDTIDPNRRMVIQREVVEQIGISIAQNGQLEPIMIYQQGIRFRIIDGEKRWRAIKWLGQRSILVELKND